jgi:hypothetical protein
MTHEVGDGPTGYEPTTGFSTYTRRTGRDTVVFRKHKSGLYFAGRVSTSSSIMAYAWLPTVAENRKKFTKRQVEFADESQKLYRMIDQDLPDSTNA